MSHQFNVLIEQDENGTFISKCLDLQGCHSFGDSLDEAIRNIKEAIELCLEDDNEFGDTIPEGSLDGEIEVNVQIKSNQPF